MSKDKGLWREGRRAWERLTDWAQAATDRPATGSGARALTALSDISQLRHLLDQGELTAVREARADRRPWSEIATMLGVSRQSAWERWRDLDETDPDALAPGETPAARLLASVSAEEAARAAGSRRRRSSVTVPNVVGRTWTQANEELRGRRLVPVGVGPDGSVSDAIGPEWPGSVITDQSPESGAKVPPDSPVRLWFERGSGGEGVREPRRPKPDPLTAREERYETSDEAVG
jgi:hypothetical protein